MILRALIFCFFTFTSTSQALEITASGSVQNQGQLQIKHKARMLDGLTAAQPTGHSFLLGGMLLRAKQRVVQAKLKAGLLYDLRVAANSRFTRHTPRLAQSLTHFSNKISQLTPTGRVAAEFNLTKLASNPKKNLPLKNFDHIIIPSRPKGIYVLGATIKPGLYNYKNKSVVNIARKIKRQFANPDWVWIIQPDSSVEKVGVALWNQQLEKVAALGAIIFVPFVDKAFIGTRNFNREMTQFLSTQSISALSAQP